MTEVTGRDIALREREELDGLLFDPEDYEGGYDQFARTEDPSLSASVWIAGGSSETDMKLASEYVLVLPNGVKWRQDTPYKVWVNIVRGLYKWNKGLQFWIGDSIRFGELRYGDKAFQELGVADQTLMNWASACRKIAPSRRKDTAILNFSSQKEVAVLRPERQIEVLDEFEERAKAGELVTKMKVRERVEEIKQQDAEEDFGLPKIARIIVCPRCNGTGEITVED